LRQLRSTHAPLLFTSFFAVAELAYAFVGHSVLAYPSGRVTDRAERALVRVGYATVLAFPLAVLLFYDATRPLISLDPLAPERLPLVVGDGGCVEFLQKGFVVAFYGVLATLF